MKTLHIAPGDSAGGSLLRAIRDAGQDDEVLRFRDDLSCGPIASDDPSSRSAWWEQFYEGLVSEDALRSFWDRVTSSEIRLVVWFGRHSASELAFFLAWTDRLGDKPYDVIDVTGRRLPSRGRDGSTALSQSAQSVSIMQPDGLKSLLGTERPIPTQERDESRQRWRRLRAENAPFRIVTEAGLASAPLDYFDPWIFKQVTTEWRSVARIVGRTMQDNCEPYFQISDLVLQARVVALVEEGRLLAEGDPWEMRSCRIRLPG